ncbi:outer membrane protein assembly factor BamE [Gammaproteobacteria bacterium]|nr:outer membrane protein assembly factor BamE [Gammaproteobacteria bacterium]
MRISFQIVIISIFFLNSCANNFYQVPVAQGNIISASMLAKLEPGLTKAQVRYIMGTPSIKDPFNMDRWDYIGFEIIGDNKSSNVHHTLVFEENKLISWNKKIASEVNENLEEKSKEQSKRKLEK